MSTAAVRICLSELAATRITRPDSELLSQYTLRGDQDAFAQLVRRHGPVVLAACRRVLGPTSDADDAFQTTFLALARHASSVRGAAALPAWLHRTAFRAALRARSRRPATVPLPADVPNRDDPLAEVAWRDVRVLLDEELDRLPEKFRAPVLLCLLGGLARDEAADRLGYSLNTLKRRLESGRELLRARLLRRGVAPVALAAALLDGDGLLAAVPAELLASTARHAHSVSLIPAVGSLRALVVAAAVVVGLGAAAVAIYEPQPIPAGSPVAAVVPSLEATDTRTDAQGDPLPAGALLRIGTTRFRDGGPTNQAILSPDGKVLATASEAGVMLFDLATGRRLHWIADSGVPSGYDANFSRFAFTPDGKKLFTVYAPGAMSLAVTGAIAAFDTATGKKLTTFKAPPLPRQPNQPGARFDSGYTRLWFPAGSKHLVANRHDQTVLLDPDSGNEVRSLSFEAKTVVSTPAGVRLFVVPKDGSEIAIHDDEGNLTCTLKHTIRSQILGFDPAGTTVVAAGPKSEVRVWDLATSKVLADIAVPEKENQKTTISALAVTPDRKTLLVGMQSGAISRFDIATGKELAALRHHTGWITGLFFPDGGKTLVSSAWDHAIIRWDLSTGKPLPDARGYGGYLHIDRSPDGKLIAATDAGGRVELLDGSSARLVKVLQESGKPGVSKVSFSPDGSRLVTGHTDAKLRVWETDTGKLIREIEVGSAPKGRGAWFRGMAFAPDGGAIVVSADELGTRLFDIKTGKQLWDSSGQSEALAYLVTGRSIVSGGWGSKIQYRDAATGKITASIASRQFAVDDVAASPDGRLLATGERNGILCLRDPETGAVRQEWQAHTPGDVTWGVSFGPGGIWLASVGDRTVGLWDVATGKLLRRFEGHTSRAWSIQFALDGRTVLSSSMDLTGYVWDIRPKLGAADARTAEQLWVDLAGEPEVAFRAVWLAASDPKAVEVFGKKVPASVKPDPARFKKLVEELASAEFPTREAAEKALTKFGPAALTLAHQARSGSDSDEVRTRLDRVMKGWTQGATSPENWRRRRAIVAMALANSAESRALLKRWAADAPGTILSDDAAAALQRLERLNPPSSR